MKYIYINLKYIFQTASLWPCSEDTKFRFAFASKICCRTFPSCAASFAPGKLQWKDCNSLHTDQSYHSFNFIPIPMNTSCSQSILQLKNIIPKIRCKAHKSKVLFLRSLFVYVLTLNIRFTS